MSIKLSETAFKELKTAFRDYKTKGRIEKMLSRIQEDAYQQGYIDCYNVTNNKIKQVVANALNPSTGISDNNDGVVIQSEGSELGERSGTDADDADSGEGSLTNSEYVRALEVARGNTQPV